MYHRPSFNSRTSPWAMLTGILALTFCLFLTAPEVCACRGKIAENTLFFDKVPSSEISANADVIAKVILIDVNDGYATVKITQIIKASGVSLHQGDKVFLKYKFTSCGPNHKAGAEGIVIAKVGSNHGSNITLYPYVHRISDGRLEVPDVTGRDELR